MDTTAVLQYPYASSLLCRIILSVQLVQRACKVVGKNILNPVREVLQYCPLGLCIAGTDHFNARMSAMFRSVKVGCVVFAE